MRMFRKERKAVKRFQRDKLDLGPEVQNNLPKAVLPDCGWCGSEPRHSGHVVCEPTRSMRSQETMGRAGGVSAGVQRRMNQVLLSKRFAKAYSPKSGLG